MEDREFRALVKLMREKQREFFRAKDRDVLRECIDLERQVDEALKPPPPPSLFHPDQPVLPCVAKLEQEEEK